MRFFNLRIVFVVVFLILLMSFVVLEYCVVDVGLFYTNYLVVGLGVTFLFVDLLEMKEGIGDFMVNADTMILCRLKFRDHCRWLELFNRRMIGMRISVILKYW